MPELPEVETVRRGLEPALLGQVIVRAAAYRPDLRWPLPERFVERLTGRRVQALRRRSKYLLADLDDGETWITHLGMSGRMLIAPLEAARETAEAPGVFHREAGAEGAPRDAHDHVVLETGVSRVTYNDARRFGAMDLWPTADLERHRLLAAIGPEPLSNAFHAGLLIERLRGRATSIKAALLDQRLVAGLGNIYVCEALWRAGISPKRAAGSIAASRLERLAQAIREVLQDAIAAGGSSLKDYRQADGELGYFQHSFSVYDREGEPCRRDGCPGHVVRIVQSARSSFYCPRCQR